MKQCTKCNEIKELDKFCYVNKTLSDKRTNVCRKCGIARNIAFNQIPKNAARKRGTQLRRWYWPHLTVEGAMAVFYDMMAKQNHACALCLIPRSSLNRDFAVDHCHETGVIRGLLCNACNRSLVKNNTIESTTRLLNYLKNGAKKTQFVPLHKRGGQKPKP